LLSASPYQWIIGEVQDNRRFTICDISVLGDDARDVYIPLTIVLILVSLIRGTLSYIRTIRMKPALLIGAALLLFWIYRFFLRHLGC